MAHDIAFDGKVTNVNLDLPRNYQAIFRLSPLGQAHYSASSKEEFLVSNLRIKIFEFVNGRIEEGWYRECLLHGALDEAVWQSQSAR